jgi:hypothetical protein
MKTAEKLSSETILDVQPEYPVARLPQQGTPYHPPQGGPNLAAALTAAIKSCPAVEHDRKVSYPGVKYNYASSEAIIDAARRALADNGLAVVPISQQVNGHERTGPDRYELAQQRLLVHTSGESLLCSSVWPICPDKGRALDKATAAADTLSLAYFLRDLLQMPRVAPDDEVASRNDRPPEPALPDDLPLPPLPPPPSNGQVTAAPAPAASSLTAEEQATLAEKARGKGDWVRALLALFSVSRAGELPRKHVPIFMHLIEHHVFAEWVKDKMLGSGTFADMSNEELTKALDYLKTTF